MTEENTRLKKLISDQEEAVQIARETLNGGDPLRIDAVNVALSLAHSNAVGGDRHTSMTELLRDAAAAEKYLKGDRL